MGFFGSNKKSMGAQSVTSVRRKPSQNDATTGENHRKTQKRVKRRNDRPKPSQNDVKTGQIAEKRRHVSKGGIWTLSGLGAPGEVRSPKSVSK